MRKPGDLRDHHRQADGERRATTGAITVCGHGTAVHLGQPSYERQADAEATLRALGLRVHLREQLEDLRQQIWRNSNPAVRDRDQRVLSLTLHAETNAPARIHEL